MKIGAAIFYMDDPISPVIPGNAPDECRFEALLSAGREEFLLIAGGCAMLVSCIRRPLCSGNTLPNGARL